MTFGISGIMGEFIENITEEKITIFNSALEYDTYFLLKD